MKKTTSLVGIFLLVFALFTTTSWALLDYSAMTNDQLFELRGAIQNAPEEEQQAYQAEWEKRLADMSDEDKKMFSESAESKPDDDGKAKQMWTPGRGYEQQGVQGRVIPGSPLPPGGLPGM